MTLVILALAGAMLSAVCRQGMKQSLRAAEDIRQLQRKWGMLSCQSTLLPNAESLLAQKAPRDGRTAASLQCELDLGGQHYRLIFADEQAKVNLNTLYQARGRQETEKYVRQAMRASGGASQVVLRPLHHDGTGQTTLHSSPPIVFGSFGQVFSDSDNRTDASSLISATRDMTCWGNGRLNYRRASDAQITTLVGNEPDLLKKMIARRNAPPVVAQALDPLNLSNKSGKILDELFTDTSNCFSLWMIVQDRDGVEARRVVREMGDDGILHISCFSR